MSLDSKDSSLHATLMQIDQEYGVTCARCNKSLASNLSENTRVAPARRLCDDCKMVLASEEREAFLKKRASLPVEDRLSLLEADMYDHKTGHRREPDTYIVR